MWWIFALKLFLFTFLWDRFLDFSISGWGGAVRQPAAIVGRLLSYGIGAMPIAMATALTIVNRSWPSKIAYFLIGLVAAMPAAALHLEEDHRLIGLSVIINSVLYASLSMLFFRHPDYIPSGIIRPVVEWLAVS